MIKFFVLLAAVIIGLFVIGYIAVKAIREGNPKRNLTLDDLNEVIDESYKKKEKIEENFEHIHNQTRPRGKKHNNPTT